MSVQAATPCSRRNFLACTTAGHVTHSRCCCVRFPQMGVTHMWNGVAIELVPHHEWIRNAELFAILKKLVFFKKQRLFLVSQSRHPSPTLHASLQGGSRQSKMG